MRERKRPSSTQVPWLTAPWRLGFGLYFFLLGVKSMLDSLRATMRNGKWLDFGLDTILGALSAALVVVLIRLTIRTSKETNDDHSHQASSS